jgi:hypothetical protein
LIRVINLSRNYGKELEALILAFYNYPYKQSEKDSKKARRLIFNDLAETYNNDFAYDQDEEFIDEFKTLVYVYLY